MTLQQILYFKEIACTQSYTRAAQNLFVSQSSLSHAIQTLEQEVGCPLFIRKSGKRVLLTKYGETLLPYAEKILLNMKDGQDALNKMHNPNNGVVTIAYSYINCFTLAPTIFKEFYKEHSYNDIAIQVSLNQIHHAFEEDVIKGSIDLAFSCSTSFDELNSTPLVKQELFLMLPADHPLAKKKSLSLYDVKDELFIGHIQNWNLSNWVSNMFKECDLHQHVMEYLPDWASEITYVSMGLGLTITPLLPVDPSLVAIVPLNHPHRFRTIYIHHAKNRSLSPAAAYVRQYCLDFFKTHKVPGFSI